MSWDYFKDKTGKTFIVNWVGVRAVIRSYLHSKLMWECSRTLIDGNWIGPDVYYIHTDFDTVKSQKECLTEVLLREFYDSALISMNVATQMLEQILAETREYDTQFTKQNKIASDRTIYNIDQSVTRGEIAAEVAGAVRNVSAEVLLVGANFVQGPLKYAALGAGSVLKGTGKYQDSGNIKAGLAEAAFSFGFGALGLKVIPANASSAQEVTLNIYLSFGQNFVGEPAKAWLGGEDLSDALASGSLKAGAAPLNELIKEQLSPAALQNLFNTNGKLKAMALPLQVGMNLLSDKSVAAIVDKSKVNSKPSSLPKQENEDLLDTTLLDKRFIQNAAVKVYN